MAWHANDKQIVQNLKLYMARCSNCEYCQPIGEMDGHRRNRCAMKPGMVFYTFQERYCTDHPDVAWRLKRIEELKNK